MATQGRSQKSGSRRQPESLRLRSIMPSYTVNDVHKSVAWYQDGLGFHVSERWEDGGELKGVMLKAGSCQLGLAQDDFKKGRDRKKGEGFRIFCTTRKSVDDIAKRIKAKGGQLDHEPQDQPWGMRDISVTDPDGFKITIAQNLR